MAWPKVQVGAVRELAACAIALGVFAIVDLPIVFPLVAGYLVGWAAVAGAGPLIRRTGARVVLLAAAILGLRAVWIHREAMIEAEGLAGITSVLADRFANELESLGEIPSETATSTPGEVLSETARPRFTCAAPELGLAAAISAETQELFLADRKEFRAKIATAEAPSACAFAGDTVVIAHRTGLLRAGARDHALGQELSAVAFGGNQLAVGHVWPRTGVALYSWPAVQEIKFLALPEAPDWLVHTPHGFLAALRREHRLIALDSGRSLYLGRPAVSLSTTRDGRFVVLPVTGVLREGDAGGNHAIEDTLLFVDPATLRIVHRVALAGSPIGVVATSTASWTAALAGLGRIAGPAFTAEYTGAYGLADLGDGFFLATAPALHGLTIFGSNAPKTLLPSVERDDRDRGELAFFEATRSGVSCGSCHLHADSDLSFHDIGHGRASPTLSVRNIAGTSPYLRGASYPTLGSLDVFAQSILGGYDRELSDRSGLLESFLVAQLRISPRRTAATSVIERGRKAFEKAGCDDCHRGPKHTNLAQVPGSYLFPELGKTARLLDTPSLVNVVNTAPYLDDGRALTLRAVLVEHNANHRHGDVRALDPGELDALLGYLETL